MNQLDTAEQRTTRELVILNKRRIINHSSTTSLQKQSVAMNQPTFTLNYFFFRNTNHTNYCTTTYIITYCIRLVYDSSYNINYTFSETENIWNFVTFCYILSGRAAVIVHCILFSRSIFLVIWLNSNVLCPNKKLYSAV